MSFDSDISVHESDFSSTEYSDVVAERVDTTDGEAETQPLERTLSTSAEKETCTEVEIEGELSRWITTTKYRTVVDWTAREESVRSATAERRRAFCSMWKSRTSYGGTFTVDEEFLTRMRIERFMSESISTNLPVRETRVRKLSKRLRAALHPGASRSSALSLDEFVGTEPEKEASTTTFPELSKPPNTEVTAAVYSDDLNEWENVPMSYFFIYDDACGTYVPVYYIYDTTEAEPNFYVYDDARGMYVPVYYIYDIIYTNWMAPYFDWWNWWINVPASYQRYTLPSNDLTFSDDTVVTKHATPLLKPIASYMTIPELSLGESVVTAQTRTDITGTFAHAVSFRTKHDH